MKQEILYLEQIVTTQPSGQNLEYVSLSLRAGEILGVTGISESGASVLADVLCGKLCPASGTIYLDGFVFFCTLCFILFLLLQVFLLYFGAKTI